MSNLIIYTQFQSIPLSKLSEILKIVKFTILIFISSYLLSMHLFSWSIEESFTKLVGLYASPIDVKAAPAFLCGASCLLRIAMSERKIECLYAFSFLAKGSRFTLGTEKIVSKKVIFSFVIL